MLCYYYIVKNYQTSSMQVHYIYVNVSTMITPILKKWQQFTHTDSLELNICNISLTLD